MQPHVYLPYSGLGAPTRPTRSRAGKHFYSGLRALKALVLVVGLSGCAEEPPAQTPQSSTAGPATTAEPSTAVPRDQTSPPAPGAKGIDVSHFQGNIDWPTVAASGVEFVFIKATEGIDAPDPMFAANWKGAGDASLPRGAYHLFEPADSGTDQAEFFLDTVEGKALELGAVLDIEKAGDLDPSTLVSEIQAWLDAVEQTISTKPMIYTDARFWDAQVASDDFSSYPLWIAEYEVEAPTLPRGWDTWAYWQNAENTTVTGISVETDSDVAGPGPSS